MFISKQIFMRHAIFRKRLFLPYSSSIYDFGVFIYGKTGRQTHAIRFFQFFKLFQILN